MTCWLEKTEWKKGMLLRVRVSFDQHVSVNVTKGAICLRHNLRYTKVHVWTSCFFPQGDFLNNQASKFGNWCNSEIVSVHDTWDRHVSLIRAEGIADICHNFTSEWIMDLSAAYVAFQICLKSCCLCHHQQNCDFSVLNYAAQQICKFLCQTLIITAAGVKAWVDNNASHHIYIPSF